jgi:hypothetical protein
MTKLLLWLKSLWVKFKKPIIYVCLFIGLILISYIAGRCSTRTERKQQISNLIAARDSVKQFFVTIDGLKNSVWEKNAIILGQEESIKAGIIERDLLKKLHLKDLITNTELTGVIHKQDSLLNLPPNTVFITIKDTSGISRDYVRLPFTLLKISDKYVSLNAGMDSLCKAWYKLSVPFSGTISIGYVKSGFLKTTAKGIFTTENPFIKINAMDVLIIQDPKKWYSKWYVPVIAGAVGIEVLRFFVFRK